MPPASWIWPSSGIWLRPEPEENLLGHFSSVFDVAGPFVINTLESFPRELDRVLCKAGLKRIGMSTYKEIQEDIRRRHGRTVKTCWIAHVKELNGLNPHPAPNRLSQIGRRNPCPEDIRPLIEDSMRRFGMIE